MIDLEAISRRLETTLNFTNPAGDGSMSFWLRTNTPWVNNDFFMDSTTAQYLEIKIRNNAIRSRFGGPPWFDSTQNLSTNGTLYHCCLLKRSANQRACYVNGQPRPGLTNESTSTAADGRFIVGDDRSYTSDQRLKLEDIRIYDRTLSEKEIIQIYEGYGHDYIIEGLLHWYPMCDGAENQIVTEEKDIVGKVNLDIVNSDPTYIGSDLYTFGGIM